MKRLIAEYFSNLEIPEPDPDTDPDFEQLRQQIRSVIDITPDQIYTVFNWQKICDGGNEKGFLLETMLIEEMAETILADNLYLDEDEDNIHTIEIFTDEFVRIMKDMYREYLMMLSDEIERKRTQGTTDDIDGARMLSGMLDLASWQIARLAYFQSYQPELEDENDHSGSQPFLMNYGEMNEDGLKRLTSLRDVFEPYLCIHNEEVLPFIRYDLFSEEILESFAESEDVLKALESFSDEQKQRVFDVAKAEIDTVRKYFQLERETYNQTPQSIRAPFSTTASNWGEAVRLEMEEAATFIAIEAICIECEKTQDQPSAPIGPSL